MANSGRYGTVARTLAVAGASALALAVLGGCAGEDSGGKADADSRMAPTEERSDSYAGAEKLTVENADGDTEVVGADVDEIRVDRELRYGGKTAPEESVEKDGDTLAIRTGACGGEEGAGDNPCRISYTVTVPFGTSVEIDNEDGGITVTGTGASVAAATEDGDVTASGAMASLAASSGDGGLVFDGLESPEITAFTVDGGIDITAFGDVSSLSAESEEGAVTVAVPEKSGPYAVTATADGGSTAVDVPEKKGAEATLDLTAHDGELTASAR